MKKRYAVGIDAGKTTGFCLSDRQEKKTLEFWSGDFWLIYRTISHRFDPAETLVVIETPRKRLVYAAADGKSAGSRLSRAFNSGENNREATLLIAGLESDGFEVRKSVPEASKWTKEDLKRFTGIADRTNEHVRDAIKLVWQI